MVERLTEGRPWQKDLMIVLLLGAVAFWHLLLPNDVSNSYLEIISVATLAALCLFIYVARENYKDFQFRKLSDAFLIFGALFLFADLITILGEGGEIMFYFQDSLWMIGYLFPILACWGAVLKYGEYMDVKKFIFFMVSGFSIALMFMVPIGLEIMNSKLYALDIHKAIAIVFLYLDTILLLSLVMLVQIYQRGKLEDYWSAIAMGVALFTFGDILNAVFFAMGKPMYATFFSFNLLGYLLLAYGFGTLAYQKRKVILMEPSNLYTVQQLFLINKAGLLMSYAGQESEIDGDIVGGMLTAVQNFIKDTFDAEGTSMETLKKLQYGGLELNIEDGEHIFLVLVLEGKGTEHLHTRMRESVESIERRYEKIVVDWGGKLDETAEITKELEYQFI